jgi:hypothetical protein
MVLCVQQAGGGAARRAAAGPVTGCSRSVAPIGRRDRALDRGASQQASRHSATYGRRRRRGRAGAGACACAATGACDGCSLGAAPQRQQRQCGIIAPAANGISASISGGGGGCACLPCRADCGRIIVLQSADGWGDGCGDGCSSERRQRRRLALLATRLGVRQATRRHRRRLVLLQGGYTVTGVAAAPRRCPRDLRGPHGQETAASCAAASRRTPAPARHQQRALPPQHLGRR